MGSRKGLSDSLNRFVSTLASIAVVAIVVLVVAEVALRSTIGFSFGFVEEIVSYLVVAVTFFGACVSFRKQAFFKVNFFYDKLSQNIRKLLDIAHAFIALIFCIPLLYYSIFLVFSSYTRKTAAPTTLATPLFIPQIIIPVATLVLIFFLGEFAMSRLGNSGNTLSGQENVAKEEN